MNKDIYTIVLAAGKGTRMNSDLPKVLHKICGRPITSYTLDILNQLKYKIVLVVGYKKELVQKEFGNKYKYAVQRKQLGTGHAVASAENQIPKEVKTILVLNGDDSAFYKPETIKGLVQKHIDNQNIISFMSLISSDPTGFGRIKRDTANNIIEIVEEKDASKEEKSIQEINVGIYCFDSQFLWNSLPKLAKNKMSGEYYLTDLIQLAVSQGKKINTYSLKDNQEWIGINTLEQLQVANKQMQICQNIKK
ncbi:MAG: sugar phosphate nucleotidyltransferase [bacterium]